MKILQFMIRCLLTPIFLAVGIMATMGCLLFLLPLFAMFEIAQEGQLPSRAYVRDLLIDFPWSCLKETWS